MSSCLKHFNSSCILTKHRGQNFLSLFIQCAKITRMFLHTYKPNYCEKIAYSNQESIRSQLVINDAIPIIVFYHGNGAIFFLSLNLLLYLLITHRKLETKNEKRLLNSSTSVTD